MDQDAISRKLPKATWGVIFVIAILIVIAGYRLLAKPEPTSSMVNAFAPSPSTLVSPEQQQAQNKLLESLEAERQAIAKARLLSVSQSGEEIEELIAELQAEIDAWRTEVEALLTNESGRLLAADDTALQAFQQIYPGDQRVSPATPGRLRDLLQSYMLPIQEALTDSARTYSPSDELSSQLLDLNIKAKQAIASYREPRQQIQSLVSAATRSGRATTPGQTLADAIAKMTEQHALQETQAIAAAVEAERIKHNRELAGLEAEHARKEGERELARKILEEQAREDEAKRELARRQAEEKSKAENARLEALRKRAADPAVQAKYRPFLTKGRFLFGRGPQAWTDVPTTVSFKRLRDQKVLDNEFIFWASGAALPAPNYNDLHNPLKKRGYGGYGEGNDRPTWKGYPKTEEELRRCQECYREFLELAPFWIEMGLLRP